MGPKLANNIDCTDVNGDFTDYLKDIDSSKSMFIQPTCETEIVNIVNKFANKTSADYCGMNMKLVKSIIGCIVKPITYICNLSLKSGIFPNKMKVAKVIPIFKAGDIHSVSNYRPVSILPQLSKVIEKLFEVRLRKYIDSHNFFFSGQYGFRTSHSTSLALNEMVDMIVNAIDCNKYSIGVFIDLKKAFDTVNHELLIKKFKYYGIRGPASQFIQSYLSNRKQYVQYKDHKSSEMGILCGVPQGSILGPLLFLLYINDMYKVSKLLHFIIFADDTNIFYLHNDPVELIRVVNKELVKLNIWFKINKLSLNVDKSNYMLFGKKCSQINEVILNGALLSQVSVTKFLGVNIDSGFIWDKHINTVKRKLYNVIGMLYRIKDKVETETLITIYNTLMLPHLSYCCEIWGNTFVSRLHDIIILQKRAIRLICNVDCRAHTSPLFKKYRILKFYDLIKFNSCMIMFKASNNLLPKNVQANFIKNKEIHSYGTRNREKLHVRNVKSHIKYISVNNQGVKLWNGLDEKIRSCVSLNLFKKRLKISLLNHI